MTKVCIYCGSKREIQEDHVRAKSKGGVTTVPSCKKCNTSKGNKPVMEWLRWVKKNDKYRWTRIVIFNKNKRNDISRKVRKIREEK